MPPEEKVVYRVTVKTTFVFSEGRILDGRDEKVERKEVKKVDFRSGGFQPCKRTIK